MTTYTSIAINRGLPGMKSNDFVVGTDACPTTTNDFEFCIGQTDQLGNPVTREDAVLALEKIIKFLQRGSNLGGISWPNRV